MDGSVTAVTNRKFGLNAQASQLGMKLVPRLRQSLYAVLCVLCGRSRRPLRFKIFYFSRATTKSGAHSSARLISELGKVQMALRAASAYSAARALAASRAP